MSKTKTTLFPAGTTKAIRINPKALAEGEAAISIQDGSENVTVRAAEINGPSRLIQKKGAPIVKGCISKPGVDSVWIETEAEIAQVEEITISNAPLGSIFRLRGAGLPRVVVGSVVEGERHLIALNTGVTSLHWRSFATNAHHYELISTPEGDNR